MFLLSAQNNFHIILSASVEGCVKKIMCYIILSIPLFLDYSNSLPHTFWNNQELTPTIFFCLYLSCHYEYTNSFKILNIPFF